MTINFCADCGVKLVKSSNFCGECGYSLKSQTVTEVYSDKNKQSQYPLVTIIISLLAFMFSFSYFTLTYLLAFRWSVINGFIMDSMGYYGDSEMMTLITIVPSLIYVGVLFLRILFNNYKILEYVVKIMFLTSIIASVLFTLQLLFIGISFVFNELAISSIYGNHISTTNLYETERLLEGAKAVLSAKRQVLLVNLFSVLGFMSIVLNQYFKKHQLKFSSGLKDLYNNRNFNRYSEIFKELK